MVKIFPQVRRIQNIIGGGGQPTVVYLESEGEKDSQALGWTQKDVEGSHDSSGNLIAKLPDYEGEHDRVDWWGWQSNDNEGTKDSQAWAITQPDAEGVKDVGLSLLSIQSDVVGLKDSAVITGLGVPIWQSVATANVPGGSPSIVVGKPSGTVQGDLMIAHIGRRAGSSTITAPSGWTTIQSASSPGVLRVTGFTFWKIAGVSEASTYTFTYIDTASFVTGEIHRYIGTHATAPINASAVATLNATALVPDPLSPSVTTTVTNCLVVSFLAHDHASLAQTHTPPSGAFVERSDFEAAAATLYFGAHSMDRVYPLAGSTGTVAHDCTEIVATDAVMTRIAIAPGNINIIL